MSVSTRRAIYGKLAGDTTLNNLLATPPERYSKSIYYEEAPDDADLPYVIFNKQSGVPTYTFKQGHAALDEEIWLVKGVDGPTEDADTVDAISDRLDALLTDGSISISGKTQLYLRREGSDIDYPEKVDGQRYLHAGSLFRLVYQ